MTLRNSESRERLKKKYYSNTKVPITDSGTKVALFYQGLWAFRFTAAI